MAECAPNMDAVQLLAEYYLQTGHLGDEVLDAMQRAMAGITSHLLSPDGGVHFTLPGNDPATQEDTNYLMTGLGFAMESLRFCKSAGLSTSL